MQWHDIMRLAAYRQHNPKIPETADLCSTGRLKRGYGVEPMLRLLSGNRGYQETHNAIFDALQAALIEYTGYQAEQFALIHPGGAVGERLNK